MTMRMELKMKDRNMFLWREILWQLRHLHRHHIPYNIHAIAHTNQYISSCTVVSSGLFKRLHLKLLVGDVSFARESFYWVNSLKCWLCFLFEIWAVHKSESFNSLINHVFNDLCWSKYIWFRTKRQPGNQMWKPKESTLIQYNLTHWKGFCYITNAQLFKNVSIIKV